LLKQFATIGIGPGLDVDAQPDNVKDNLVRDATPEAALLERCMGDRGQRLALRTSERGPVRRRAAVPGGRPVARRHHPQRPREAVYLVNFTDDSGAKFSGDSRYELQFTGDTLPPVDAFSCSAWGRRVPCADIGRSLISSDDCLDVSSLVWA
jgi:hypothetical protein